VGYLSRIESLLTLVQRQAAPFAYVNGASHSGLTGNGHLDVQGLLGAKVELTTVPGRLGIASGDPDTLFDAGFLRWGSSSGAATSQRIDTTPFLSFPGGAGQFTRISYSLAGGVVATITELVREP
jgi:hypothetical protein